MAYLFNVSSVERAIIVTVQPVEGSDKSASVAFLFTEEELTETVDIAGLFARRLKSVFRTLEDHIIFTAQSKAE